VPLLVEVYAWMEPSKTLARVSPVTAGRDELLIVVPEVSPAPTATARVHGQVLDRQGMPPRALKVVLINIAENRGPIVRIEAGTGRFERDGLRPGDYKVAVQANNNPWFEQRVEGLADGEDRDLGVITIPEEGRVRVRLHAPEGVSTDNVLVSLLVGNECVGIDPESRVGAEILFPPVFADTGELVVQNASGAVTDSMVAVQHIPVTIGAGNEQVVDVDVRMGVYVAIDLELAEGTSTWEHVTVSITDAAGQVVRQEDWSRDNFLRAGCTVGTGEILEAGSYTLSVKAVENVLVSSGFSVPPRPATPVELKVVLAP
jgi:hypothetical protein